MNMFPFLVSRGRYLDMRERAERAEELADRLFYRLEKVIEGRLDPSLAIPYDLRGTYDAERTRIPQPTEAPQGLEAPPQGLTLPPVVEEAINRRAVIGSPLEAQLKDEATTAMEVAGPDFDADAYAEQIMTGTRINGWPL